MATTKEAKEAKIKTREEYLNERVPCIIRKPENTDESFTTVTVNGKNYQIEYNRQVLVPRFVKEAIDNSYKADEEAYNRQAQLESEAGEGR